VQGHHIRGGTNLKRIDGRLAQRSFSGQFGAQIDQREDCCGTSESQDCAPTGPKWFQIPLAAAS